MKSKNHSAFFLVEISHGVGIRAPSPMVLGPMAQPLATSSDDGDGV
jgi:hypothetical protein